MSKGARALLAETRHIDTTVRAAKAVVSPKTLNERSRKAELKNWDPEDDEWTGTYEESVPTPLCLFYFFCAWLVSCLPIYLYTIMFGMGTQHAGLFAIVTTGALAPTVLSPPSPEQLSSRRN